MQLYKLRPRFAGRLFATVLVALFSVCRAASPPTSAAASLRPFFSSKEQQARELSEQDPGQMPALMVEYFEAVARSDWRSLSNAYEKMSLRRAPADGRNPDRQYQTAAWQTVMETSVAWEKLVAGDGKFARAFGQGIIDSLPAGCVYFGGTDPGRFFVTALIKSHQQADPFFVVTQNQLADGTYLTYLRSMFDGKLHTPSNTDSQKAFQDYMDDAQSRMARGQLRPGEDVKVVDNRVQVSGQVAVMAINGLLCKVIFDQNPQREFFVEESFALDWMYPRLTPHALIMKINREPLANLPESSMEKDHEYWTKYCSGLIGNWISYDTSVAEVTAFAERVYLRKNYESFQGDRAFARDDDAQKAFAKLRSSIAGLYAWRFNETAPRVAQIEARQKPSQPDSITPDERRMLNSSQRLTREAEFAFKQSYALCPTSPEALYRYVQLLAGARRFSDALLLARTSSKLETTNRALVTLISELEKMQAQTGDSSRAAGADLQPLEDRYRTNPSDLTNLTALVQKYASVGRTQDVMRIADALVANPKSDAKAISFAAQVYQQLANYPALETALARWVELTPTPEAWLDYAAAQAVQGKKAVAIVSLRQALALNAARLKTNPQAADIAPGLKDDPRYASLRTDPDFKKLITPNP